MSTHREGNDMATDAEFRSKSSEAKRWGIGLVPWLWGTPVRILFVVDGRINALHGDEDFGLGPVIDTLKSRWFAWWVRFQVTFKRRDAPDFFRFTQDNLSHFDQVWFFGDFPGEIANNPAIGDEVIEQETYSPLADGELRVLAEWMQRGGGVFAAGDHSILGASMNRDQIKQVASGFIRTSRSRSCASGRAPKSPKQPYTWLAVSIRTVCSEITSLLTLRRDPYVPVQCDGGFLAKELASKFAKPGTAKATPPYEIKLAAAQMRRRMTVPSRAHERLRRDRAAGITVDAAAITDEKSTRSVLMSLAPSRAI
jgi:hypothetical protein